MTMGRLHNVLVVGVGSIGERHVRCFQATGRAIVWICDVNTALCQTIADRYGVKHAFDSYDAALAARPDAIVIATPAHLHVPLAFNAARNGAHLLVEKPLSTRLERIDELIEEVARLRITAAVAYVYRCHPALAGMRDALRSSKFGKPVQLIATCGQHFPTHRPAYREIYYADRHTGGGAVQDALTHIIDAGQWLVGPVDRLVADIGHQVLEGVSIEDTAHVLARHGQVMGCYVLNQHQAPDEMTITVVCAGGTVRFENHANRWRWMSEPDADWHDELEQPIARDAIFVRQANAFLDAVEGRSAPRCTLHEGLRALRVCLAILESAERKCWQSISSHLAQESDHERS
jgi:predicted dehydrogenase